MISSDGCYWWWGCECFCWNDLDTCIGSTATSPLSGAVICTPCPCPFLQNSFLWGLVHVFGRVVITSLRYVTREVLRPGVVRLTDMGLWHDDSILILSDLGLYHLSTLTWSMTVIGRCIWLVFTKWWHWQLTSNDVCCPSSVTWHFAFLDKLGCRHVSHKTLTSVVLPQWWPLTLWQWEIMWPWTCITLTFTFRPMLTGSEKFDLN